MSVYNKGDYRNLTWVKLPDGGYIVWNWDHHRWDKFQELPDA